MSSLVRTQASPLWILAWWMWWMESFWQSNVDQWSCTWTWSHECAWTRLTSWGRNQNQDTCPQGLLSLTAKSWLRCCCISKLQIFLLKSYLYFFWVCISDLLKIDSKFGHQVMSLALLVSKVGHQAVSLALPHCLGMPYWHYQLVLSLYLHQPESHQLSFTNVSQSVC